MVYSMWLGVYGSGFRLQGLGIRFEGVQGSGYGHHRSECAAHGGQGLLARGGPAVCRRQCRCQRQ
jgi:hypothetical protein